MSLFKKIVSKIMNQPEDEENQSLEKLGDSLRNADLDYKFAQLFTHSGGFFNYCADEAEALQTLNQIIKIEGIRSIFCCDKELRSFLDVIKTQYTNDLELYNDAAFITCEYLIAFDGRIMLSHNNIKHFHSSRLPEKVIVIANISQIVSNLNEAMSKIKRNGNVKNLTSISGSQNKLDAPSKNNTKLFLLLLED
ncbi:MAG: hypothetical protein ABS44_06245 [Chryseobacterium sp. SCN 40-13]|nr:MAG: hypothetical protein ABS44_06245 [Chryseobacterium sp. SCN 40-13]